MDLSVVIVNYNVRYFLEQALLSVRRAIGALEVEVWVVDNNSVDDSVSMVREKFPEVRLIVNTDNTGFAVANNQAIRLCSGRYILLLNPDTVVEEDTFQKCVAFMDTYPDAGGLGVRMIDGSGKFLPESKRGFPTPWAAFCKTFGLSRLFPRSQKFNQYHLGYLDEHQTHEVEVLAGAFMLMRSSALEKAGLLDEAFFMYGEDIDLSYRLIKAGYKNYYYPHTSIIHYKGESTKKGSLNYVRVFYQAMIIFARKHFVGRQARLFVLMLQVAIYFRAAITLIGNLFRQAYLPVMDALLMWSGLAFTKHFWAVYHFKNPDYYDNSVLYIHFPIYVIIWITGIYLNGGYDAPLQLRRLVRGLLGSTLLLAAIYGLLNQAYRPSRALLLLGAAWAMAGVVGLRLLLHLFKYGNLNLGRERLKNLVIVGSLQESARVNELLHKAGVLKNHIGLVAPREIKDQASYLGNLSQLAEIAHIYQIQEIIFCSKDVAVQDIMYWMSKLGPDIDYKIVPEESLSIIGSSSKNTAGELYTIEIKFTIATPAGRRNKRLFDLGFCLFLLLTLPIQLLIIKHPLGLLANLWQVLGGRWSWVGYAPAVSGYQSLPALRRGVLSPLDGLYVQHLPPDAAQRLNFFYAKDYDQGRDLEICWKGYRRLGRTNA